MKLAEAETAPPHRPRKSSRARLGPGRPTRAQIDARNAALLDHVMEQLLEKGFDGVNIREVLQSLGMAKRTLTGRFGNKTSLCKAALERAIDGWATPAEELCKLETADFRETLHRISQCLVSSYMSPQGMRIAQVTNAEAHRMPEISAYVYRRCTEPLVAYFAGLFRRSSTHNDGFPDAEDYALSFLNLIGTPSRILRWGIELDDIAIEKRIAHTVELFLNGLEHRPV